MSRGRGIHFTHPSGGPCWSRDRGYHQPDPLPAWFHRIATAPPSDTKDNCPICYGGNCRGGTGCKRGVG